MFIGPQIAVARVCVAAMMSGVPVGAPTAMLLRITNGWPLDVTRTEPTVHCPVTQGPFAAGGGGNAQPATTYGAAIVTVGCPMTVTRGFGTVGCACPPGDHRTVAPTCTRNPGICFLLRKAPQLRCAQLTAKQRPVRRR